MNKQIKTKADPKIFKSLVVQEKEYKYFFVVKV